MFLIIIVRLITSLWKQQIQNRGRFARGSLFIHKEYNQTRVVIGEISVNDEGNLIKAEHEYNQTRVSLSLISLNLSDPWYLLTAHSSFSLKYGSTSKPSKPF